MSLKKRRSKKIKKLLRYTLALLMYPFVFVIGSIYKLVVTIKTHKSPKIKFNDIVAGFSYIVVQDSEIEKLATARAKICSQCPLAKYNGKLNTIMSGDTAHHIKGMYCDGCGCALAAKVRSENDRCPKGKW